MPNLILVPTPIECEIVRGHLDGRLNEWTLQICGFGLVASAAAASRWIHQCQPARVMLLGIAGTYDTSRCPIGTAATFDAVICDGIGIGAGENFRSAGQMGWDQLDEQACGTGIGDVISLPTCVPDVPTAGSLVSVCAASSTPEQATRRRDRHPTAVAEDMEGFAVAVAAAIAAVPVQVVRGFSNAVGDRDHKQWRTEEALIAACDLAAVVAERDWLPAS